jgi:copper transport protein
MVDAFSLSGLGVRHRSGPRPGLRFLAVVAGAGMLVVLAAGSASAHATLVSATPQQGSQVSVAPSSVTLTFSEGVGLSARSVEVLDPSGRRVDKGNPHHPAGQPSTVAVDLNSGLRSASYAVVWHVVSADSHPIEGTYSFGIRLPAGAAPADAAGSTLVGGLDGLFRWIAYVGAVLLLGGTAFLIWIWPGGLTLTRPRRLLTVGWLASVFGAVGLFLLQGPYGAGLGLGDLADPGLAGDTLATRYGELMLLRLAVLAFAVPAMLRLTAVPRDQSRASGWAVAGLGVVFVVTFSLSQHAGQGDLVPVWAGLDALHLAAASVWVGGLAMLAWAMLGRSTAADLASVLLQWSRLAMVAVATLVVTGTAQAWRQIGSLAALTRTEYGLLVIGKVAGTVVVLVLADFGRRWMNRRTRGVAVPLAVVATVGPVSTNRLAAAGTPTASVGASTSSRTHPVGPSVGRLRASVTAEVGIAAVVLAMTSVLVNTVPADIAFAPPYSATVVGRGNNDLSIRVRLDVDRTKVGLATIRIYTSSKIGAALPFVAVDGSLTERTKGLGPVRFSFVGVGPGHGTAASVVVPAPGRWTLTTHIRTDQSTDYAATTTYTVS